MLLFWTSCTLFFFKSSGFWVEFRKDIYNHNQLKELGLNERQIKAVLFVKSYEKIFNSDYQKINDSSRNTASNDLAELVKKGILIPGGQRGAGAFYTLSGIAQ
jgi:ATP-dependent DNA helicase RecG